MDEQKILDFLNHIFNDEDDYREDLTEEVNEIVNWLCSLSNVNLDTE